MHAISLVDLAATLAFHGATLWGDRHSVPTEISSGYWVVSRNRLDQWHLALAEAKRLEQTHQVLALKEWWDTHQPLMEEVLVSEILSRTIAAVGQAMDHWQGVDELSPITQSVLESHLDARRRVLRLLASGRGGAIDAITRLNKLRALVERWSDLLIGHIAAHDPSVVRLGIEPHRVINYARDAIEDRGNAYRRTTCWLLSGSMRAGLLQYIDGPAYSPEANQALSELLLLCIRPELFDSFGTLKSLWLHRLQQGSDQLDRVMQALTSPAESAPILDDFAQVRASRVW